MLILQSSGSWPGGTLSPGGHLATFGDICGCLVALGEEVLLATRGFAIKDIARHPTMHRIAATTTRSYLPQNASSAKVVRPLVYF